MRGLYIHIPFCKHICNYCDFPKRALLNNNQIEKYIDFLINDMDNYSSYYNSVKTVYIGGGTPNILSDQLLERLLSKINSLFKNIEEFTIECNPEFVSETQVSIFKKYNINRISLGVESFNDDILKMLNRYHTKEDVYRAISLFKKYGIKNINIDLIFAHPTDSLDNIKYNLEEFYKLDIPHLSYYSLILEEKTVFMYQFKNKEIELIDTDQEALMYEYIINNLKSNGYHHYETSNFTKIGYESKHNTLYWDSLEYIGLGAGASGYLDSIRYTNPFKLSDYYNHKNIIKEELSMLDKKKEFMMLGFRKIDGIKFKDYEDRFNSKIALDFDLKPLIDKGLISIDEEYIKLTDKGIMLANEVFIEFV